MRIITNLIDRLIKRSMRTPYSHLTGYMERYWVFNAFDERPGARRTILPSLRLHHILRSDNDDAFHDHPWPYLTLVLRGGYWEVRPVFDKSGIYIHDDRRWHGPGAILYRRANTWHRLELVPGQTAWTLFTTGRYRQTWGFLPNPAAKIPYRQYLGLPPKDTTGVRDD